MSRSKEGTTAEHGPVDHREALGYMLCSDLIHELQMGDVTRPTALAIWSTDLSLMPASLRHSRRPIM